MLLSEFENGRGHVHVCPEREFDHTLICTTLFVGKKRALVSKDSLQMVTVRCGTLSKRGKRALISTGKRSREGVGGASEGFVRDFEMICE
jgi:hypothetical protein